MLDWLNRVHLGDCRDTMRAMIAAGVRVNMVCTSPPYWGLRDYGIPPTVWGGMADCAHEWGDSVVACAASYEPNSKVRWNHRENGRGEEQAHMLDRAGWERKDVKQGQFCRCGAWLGNLGLEPDFRMFITNMVEVFGLVRELLTDDGVCFVNLGDSYAGSWGAQIRGNKNGEESSSLEGSSMLSARQITAHPHGALTGSSKKTPGLKPKDLCMIPARVAIALQDDGWYLRSAMPWLKRNGMPDSVTDRPAQSIEYVYMLTKRERYYWDGEAVKVRSANGSHQGGTIKAPDGWATHDGGHGSFHKDGREKGKTRNKADSFKRDDSKRAAVIPGQTVGTHRPDREESQYDVSARNFRVTDPFFSSWQGMWTDDAGDPLAMIVNTRGYKGAHFATYPAPLVRPLILAATSAHGHCVKCGAGWKRIVEKGEPDVEHQRACGGDVDGEYHGEAIKEYAGTGAQDPSAVKARVLAGMREKTTTGWQASCKCDAAIAPAVVFDPFIGSGTTGEVAQQLGRQWIGCDISTEYGKLQDERTAQQGLAL